MKIPVHEAKAMLDERREDDEYIELTTEWGTEDVEEAKRRRQECIDDLYDALDDYTDDELELRAESRMEALENQCCIDIMSWQDLCDGPEE